MSNCCSHGTFLHFSLQSSHLNICYYHQDLHRRPFHPGSRQRLRHDRRALLLVGTLKTSLLPTVSSIVRRLIERHPFSRLVDSVGARCYTLLSGFRLPWPPSCCQYRLTPFVGSDECRLRHLNSAFGSPRIASSAYRKKWPTKSSHPSMYVCM